MKNQTLSETQIISLRSRGLLHSEEFAYTAGDLVIAENPVTGEKRVLGQSTAVLVETNKRILKG